MLIEATPRDLATWRELVQGLAVGETVQAPEGVTVTYQGTIEFRSLDVQPVIEFAVGVAAFVTGDLLASWIKGQFRGRVRELKINHREVDLDDEGQVRRIVEEERDIRWS